MCNLGGLVRLFGGMKTVNSEVVGGVMSTASSRVVRAVSQDFRSGLLQSLHGTLCQVGIITDKVVRDTIGTINIVLVSSIRCYKCSERHDILGECTSLIRADNGDGSKSFNSREGTDDGVLSGHDLNGIRVCECHNSLKTFGNHGNGTDEGNVNGTKNFALVCFRVEEGRQEGGDTHGTDGNEEVLGNLVNLVQYICLDGFGVINKTIDGTNLGKISG